MNIVLFLVPVSIWGSTWLMIRLQLGLVDPLVSVAYRFVLAGVVLLVFCLLRRKNLRFGLKDHLFMALQGLFLFGFNYWLVYEAEVDLPSGLVAIVFSTIVFFNVLNGAVWLKAPVRLRVVAGGVLGITGIGLTFLPELAAFSLSDRSALALILTLVSVFLASLGNIISVRNQRAGLSVVQANAFGMLYGGLAMCSISWIAGKPFLFDWSFPYVFSLAYLCVLGSIVAFGFYLTLVGRIGADKAAYVALVMPVVAMILSTIFEGYDWTPSAFVGVFLVLSGNFLALRREPR